MKCLITGGGGFLGKHLIDRLEKEGFEVIKTPRNYLQNIRLLNDFVLRAAPDYIFNMAAYGNHGFQKDELEIVNVNFNVVVNLLAATKDIPYEAFIQFGSSSEYGEKEQSMKETDSLDTNSFYGATKAAATLYARAFAKQFNKPIVIVRPFSVYGEGEADFRFIPTVIKNIINQTSFPLEPYATHDWIYVEDFIDGVMKALDTGQTINIGTGEYYTNLEVVSLLEEIAKKKAQFELVSGIRPDHSFHWVSDNKRLKALGWKQAHSLKQGLTKTFEYYKEKYV